MQKELIERWGLDDPESENIQTLATYYNWTYPLIRKPYVIQPDADGVFRFAALNTKNSTTHNE